MLLSLIFLYSAIEVSFVNSARSNCNRTLAITELHGFNNHVLSRRIRSITFPSKAMFVMGIVTSKAVLDGRPRGLAYITEYDMSFLLPDTIEAWKPTILNNKLKDKVATVEPLMKSLPKTRKNSGTHSQNFNTSTREDAIQPNLLYDYYNFPFSDDKGTSDVRLEWKPKTMNNSSNRSFEINANKFNDFASSFRKATYSSNKYKRSSSELSKQFTAHESLLADESVHDLQSDREREQLHQQFELFAKIFRINWQKCMQRAICELNSRLRRPGESVFEDIIRLMLIPSQRSKIAIARDNISNVHCKKKFAVSCPYSILDSFNKNF